ncbi:MAG: hypothetical protein LBL20_00730 [Treponema sp.]|jgi:hypothetical protein|nr:hypothetical protein [Treponema sp.]
MAQNDALQENEGLDPEIAALLSEVGIGIDSSGSFEDDFSSPFPGTDGTGDILPEDAGKNEVDLSEQTLPEVTKKLEETPHDGFNNPDYYKIALNGEGDIAQRVHTIFQKYIKTQDPKDKGVYRQQISTAYWDFLSSVARKATGRISEPKKYLLRFAILHPGFLKPEQREYFAKVVVENDFDVPFYYMDEWFKAVGTGAVRPSTTDEGPTVSRSNVSAKLRQLLEKAKGKRDGSRNMLVTKNEERNNLEHAFKDRVHSIMEHDPVDGFSNIGSCYSDTQKRILGEMQELIKQLLKSDRELDVMLKDFSEADADVQTLKDKIEEDGSSAEVDTGAVDTEFGTIRQMAKMTIGRQGNHFPVCTGEYFRSGPNDVATRENVVSILARVESIDSECFYRIYRNRMNRIVPYVILIPTYGDTGICWEPFDRYNRATSRGRIAVPMYPKNLAVALLSAVADLRWQVAKEKASFYWMEEGLTGNYYQWFQANKLKGDIKEYFIQDYILWMTKESEGIQKLDKEIRGIFWRHMPFSKAVKEKLKGRSFVYQELYQRDLNRAMSDGY